jgi:hypothetical protein
VPRSSAGAADGRRAARRHAPPRGALESAPRRALGATGRVEARGIHRTRACSSLYTYCIYELRFSEDEAFRRVAAARFARRFPALLEAVSAGELHLTGLLMLGPYLNESNVVEVLARAKHRTKRELARLVRVLDPLPTVPALIEPLGPAPARLVPAAPTWEAFVQSMCPVRELTPGDRPRDWVESANDASSAPTGGDDPASAPGPDVSAPARVNAVTSDSLAPERYKVQFTATDEYVRLIEEAKALLSHAAPRATLEELHLRAMRALVSELTKKKYAERRARPRPSRAATRRTRTKPAPYRAAPAATQRTRARHTPCHITRAGTDVTSPRRCAAPCSSATAIDARTLPTPGNAARKRIAWNFTT